MRALLFALVLSSAIAGCASSSNGRYVNVASVRHEIGDVIDREAPPRRSIVSMGHVTFDLAVIYTQASATAPRREETWVHQPDGWRLKDTRDVAQAGAASAGTN